MKVSILERNIFSAAATDHRLRDRVLRWAQAPDHRNVAYLDSNRYPHRAYARYEVLVGVGSVEALRIGTGDAFPAWRAWYDRIQDWSFGHLAYDLKNEVERLTSTHPDGIGLPDLHFFRPRHVVYLQNGTWTLETFDADPERVWAQILATPLAASAAPSHASPVELRHRMPKGAYLDKVAAIREHIAAGDVYELNLCQEFYQTKVTVDPAALFRRLNTQAKVPFAAYYRLGDHYLCCASPERFLQKDGNTLRSQPIKGTSRRGRTTAEDGQLREALFESEKDRAENVMIVDLVRNDLARSCRAGSVRVEELFGIYPFEGVHQMISTVAGELRPDVHPVEAVRRAFPMGSMTGAPKVMAMQLIERYETARRGLYSGAVGYLDPRGDFDFNVVIRSLLYNARTRYLSYQVGGAIVYDSVPEQEYEECLLKAAGLRRVLAGET